MPKLSSGATPPLFTATDINGNAVSLASFKGQKIILGFYRNVNCPFCNRRIHQIMGNALRLKQSGTNMIFLFESSNERLLKSVFHQGISPWPLIGDPEKKLYTLYGVEKSYLKMLNTMLKADVSGAKKDVASLPLPKETDTEATQHLIPADFFIDESFRIVKAHYGHHLDDHVPVAELLAFAGIS
jgi:thioredoxin-dependent peroxiredoxin